MQALYAKAVPALAAWKFPAYLISRTSKPSNRNSTHSERQTHLNSALQDYDDTRLHSLALARNILFPMDILSS